MSLDYFIDRYHKFDYYYSIEKVNNCKLYIPDLEELYKEYDFQYKDTLNTIEICHLEDFCHYYDEINRMTNKIEKLENEFPAIKESFMKEANLYEAMYFKWYDEIGTHYDWPYLHYSSNPKAREIYSLYENIRDMHILINNDSIEIQHYPNYSQINFDGKDVDQVINQCKVMKTAKKAYEKIKDDLEYAKKYLDKCQTNFDWQEHRIIRLFDKLEEKLKYIETAEFTIKNLEVKQFWFEKCKETIIQKIEAIETEIVETEYRAKVFNSLYTGEFIDQTLADNFITVDSLVREGLEEARIKIQEATSVEEVETIARVIIDQDKMKKDQVSKDFNKTLDRALSYYSYLPKELNEKIAFYSDSEVEKMLNEERRKVWKKNSKQKSNQENKALMEEACRAKKAEIDSIISEYRDKIYFCEIAVEAVKAFRAYDQTVEVITADYNRAMRNFVKKYCFWVR